MHTRGEAEGAVDGGGVSKSMNGVIATVRSSWWGLWFVVRVSGWLAGCHVCRLLLVCILHLLLLLLSILARQKLCTGCVLMCIKSHHIKVKLV